MLEDQQRLKKVSNSVFTTKITGAPFRDFPVFFEFEFVLIIVVLNLNLYLNSELTYYILLGVGMRQMTSPRVSELSSKKELPVIFLSLPARKQATIHILLP
jgi:hypothetical protein